MKLRKMTAGIHGVSEVLNDCDGNPIDLYVQAGQPDAAGFNECHLASIFFALHYFWCDYYKKLHYFQCEGPTFETPGQGGGHVSFSIYV